MGSVPIGVESVSDLPFQGPTLRGQWPVTPSPPYLQPRKDQVYSSQLSGLGALLRWNFPYKFRPGLGLNPAGPWRGITAHNHCSTGAKLLGITEIKKIAGRMPFLSPNQ